MSAVGSTVAVAAVVVTGASTEAVSIAIGVAASEVAIATGVGLTDLASTATNRVKVDSSADGATLRRLTAPRASLSATIRRGATSSGLRLHARINSNAQIANRTATSGLSRLPSAVIATAPVRRRALALRAKTTTAALTGATGARAGDVATTRAL